MMKARILILLIQLSQTRYSMQGFGDPSKARDILNKRMGMPCDCRGGTFSVLPANGKIIQTVDCGTKIAQKIVDLTPDVVVSPWNHQWICVNKPKVIPKRDGHPGPCPCLVKNFFPAIHRTCYESVQQCTHTDGHLYWTAVRNRHESPGESGFITGDLNRMLAPCHGEPGTEVCWDFAPPIHTTDGGGVQDEVRKQEVEEQIKQIILSQHPELNYHPIALPENRGDLALDTQTESILQSTYALLNQTSPELAKDCWLCLRAGPPRPLALINADEPQQLNHLNCSMSLPLPVQPYKLSPNITCYWAPDVGGAVDVGLFDLPLCSLNVTLKPLSQNLCPPPGLVYVCGNSMAYESLPPKWTGLCTLATLLPDIDVIPGDEPVPIPSFDYWRGRSKRVVQAIPLLVGLGITAGAATGAAGLGVTFDLHKKLSLQMINDIKAVSETILDLQAQLDSLADVVLQNRRGLDLLTAEKGGICLFLQEKCCFYANRSGLVQDRIKQLQDNLEKRRRDLQENPFWTSFHGLLPYLLPLLGPLLFAIILCTVGPCLFNRLVQFVQQRMEAIKINQVEVHYQRLANRENESCDWHTDCGCPSDKTPDEAVCQ